MHSDDEGPGYWDINENSAAPVYQPRHGDHWRRMIRQESPAGALDRLTKRSAELGSEVFERARQLAASLAVGDTPKLRGELLERAEYLADLYDTGHGGLHGEQLATERLVWMLTEQRVPRDPDEVLAELRAGRHAELLTELWVEELTTLLTEHHALLRRQAEHHATWAAGVLNSIDAVTREQSPGGAASGPDPGGLRPPGIQRTDHP